jgi:aspartyl-tRNA(Asn)/glutamyl-tRNA(Gln) amidotransferase subunit A
MDLTDLTLEETSRLLQRGEISPVQLAQAFLERAASLNPSLNAFITMTPDVALEQAQRAGKSLGRHAVGAGRQPASLCGIPLTLKDLYETRGVLTTAGSMFFSDYVPTEDAAVVKKIARQGALFLGKTNMHEIALGVTNVNPFYGPARNPWDLARITGGSSGGSAAAVAAGMCLGSLGSDSGGSIRIPASLCGIVGLKPTYGRVSLRGVIPLSWSSDHAGPLARSVQDAALLLQAIAGYDPLDPASSSTQPHPNFLKEIDAGVMGWRIALAAGNYFDRNDPQVSLAIQAAAQVFSELGASVDEIELAGLHTAARANQLIVISDAAAYHQQRLAERPQDFGQDVLMRLQSGAAVTSSEYSLAHRTQTILRRQFDAFFDNWDILLLPTTPVAAPPIVGPDAVEQARLLTRYTAPFNLTGLPAISLPCGFNDQNLPIGLQIVARTWSEAKLLRAAYAYQQATGWHLRRPVIDAS